MFPVSVTSFIQSLGLFLSICTANTPSLMSCLAVHEYMPAYFRDYVEFRSTKPYQREREALQKMAEMSQGYIYTSKQAASPMGVGQNGLARSEI